MPFTINFFKYNLNFEETGVSTYFSAATAKTSEDTVTKLNLVITIKFVGKESKQNLSKIEMKHK